MALVVREFEAKEILQMIQLCFINELMKQVNDKKDHLSNEFELELKELNAFTNDLLNYLDRQITDTRLDFGNQIGLQIENWAITKLPYVFKKKNPNIKIDNLIFEISKTIISDVRIKLFFTATKFIWDIVKENVNDKTENLYSESDFRKFQKNLWKIIADDPELLSPEKFDKKYYCFDWLKIKATEKTK
jgi:hypothetical protein